MLLFVTTIYYDVSLTRCLGLCAGFSFACVAVGDRCDDGVAGIWMLTRSLSECATPASSILSGHAEQTAESTRWVFVSGV